MCVVRVYVVRTLGIVRPTVFWLYFPQPSVVLPLQITFQPNMPGIPQQFWAFLSVHRVLSFLILGHQESPTSASSNVDVFPDSEVTGLSVGDPFLHRGSRLPPASRVWQSLGARHLSHLSRPIVLVDLLGNVWMKLLRPVCPVL